ncbi:unnamed protein product [Paramecium octaurelia]|uniref:DNA replication factor Dna2 N-terminal domain-containing protein n=1 Tax=Paramecium octaurelia TaxID=43137 RepID=A0A8S1XQZ6_PAROT|nr:unnamed protein product [Paramecium octaurelia]
MLQKISNFDKELEEILREENRPTKKLQLQEKPQIVNRENLINNEDCMSNANYNLIIKDVLNWNEVEIDSYILSIIKRAQKQPTSHFLLILACEKFNFGNNEKTIQIFLFDHYSNLKQIRKGMQIRVNGEFIDSRAIIFTSKIQNNNSFTLEPETLVAPSTLNGLEFCRRKQFTREFFQNQCFGTTIEMISGKILHDFFQNIIMDVKSYDSLFENIEQLDEHQKDLQQLVVEKLPQSFLQPISQLYSRYIQEFYHLEKKTIREMLINIIPKCVNTLRWIQQYVQKKQPIILKQQYASDVFEIHILKWVSNEQQISSSVYGLKGFLDVVVQVKFRKNNQEFKTCYIPIELKTGAKKQSYELQVQTYLLLMNNFYKQQSQFGLLLYLNKLELDVVTCNQREMNSLFFFRNLYISETYMFEKPKDCYSKLPDLKDELKSERDVNHKCEKCDDKSVCYGLHILTGQSELTFQNPFYDNINQQLQSKTKEYLNEMLKNIRQEEQTILIPQATYYIQATKSCQTGIQITLQSKNYYLKQQANEILRQCFQDKTKITLFCIRTQQNCKYNFQDAWLVQGTQIINLIENQTDVEEVEADDQNFDYAIGLQIFLEYEQIDLLGEHLQINDELIHKLFQKNPFKHYKFIIFELATNKDIYQRKKEILIFGMEPKFRLVTEMDDNQKVANAILMEKFSKNLNEYQIKAIQLCLLAEDFALISGSYGKRKMLSHLLFLLGYANKKVLYCAADQEVIDYQIQDFIETFPNESQWVLRLQGEKDKIPENYQQYSFLFKNCKDIPEVEKKLEDKQFYFSSCQYCTDILQSQSFDYCIVDQSSKIIEPQCISCILKSKVFILLDDKDFEQPLIKSQKAKQLRISLFQRLSQQFQNVGCQQELEFSIQDIDDLF